MSEVNLSKRSYIRADEGSRILVVEDVPNTVAFILRVLSDYGYAVHAVSTAHEAIAHLETSLPDLLLLDLLLPDANGLEVCRWLREQSEADDIPVLILTADDRNTSHAEAVRAGADDFLRKPILAPELQTRVRSLLRLRRLWKELREDRNAIRELQIRQAETVQFVMHDVKNMLGALLARVEMFQEEPSPRAWKEHQEKIGGAAHSLREMVESVLDLSLADQASLDAHPQVFSAEPFLLKILSECSNFGARRRLGFDLDLSEPLSLYADPHLLRRVLFNLLDNAQRFAPANSRIVVRLQRHSEDRASLLSVADVGPGIQDDLKEQVFERLFRTEHQLLQRRGRGLGLAFCKLVADLHGGRIWVEDNEPCGSRFVLYLPDPADPLPESKATQ